MSLSYVQVAEEEGEEPIEVPCEEDGTLLLTTLAAQFPGTCGLKYRNPATGTMRGVRVSDGKLLPPPGSGWDDSLYICVFPKVTENKRKSCDQLENSSAKTKRMETKHKCSDLIVLGLPWKTTEQELRQYFESFGEVLMAQVKKDPKTGSSKGFGFIRFSNYESQARALSKRHLIDGRWCDVRIPNSKDGQVAELNRKVFIGRCTEDITADDLEEYFSKYGEIGSPDSFNACFDSNVQYMRKPRRRRKRKKKAAASEIKRDLTFHTKQVPTSKFVLKRSAFSVRKNTDKYGSVRLIVKKSRWDSPQSSTASNNPVSHSVFNSLPSSKDLAETSNKPVPDTVFKIIQYKSSPSSKDLAKTSNNPVSDSASTNLPSSNDLAETSNNIVSDSVFNNLPSLEEIAKLINNPVFESAIKNLPSLKDLAKISNLNSSNNFSNASGTTMSSGASNGNITISNPALSVNRSIDSIISNKNSKHSLSKNGSNQLCETSLSFDSSSRNSFSFGKANLNLASTCNYPAFNEASTNPVNFMLRTSSLISFADLAGTNCAQTSSNLKNSASFTTTNCTSTSSSSINLADLTSISCTPASSSLGSFQSSSTNCTPISSHSTSFAGLAFTTGTPAFSNWRTFDVLERKSCKPAPTNTRSLKRNRWFRGTNCTPASSYLTSLASENCADILSNLRITNCTSASSKSIDLRGTKCRLFPLHHLL